MYTTVNQSLKKKYASRAIRHGQYWKLNIQVNGIRKSFYSKKPGDTGRKDCAQQALDWRMQDTALDVVDTTLVHSLFQKFLQDKTLETVNIYTIENRYKNHIRPVIGSIKIGQLSNQDLKRVITTAAAKGLSKKTVMNIRGDLSAFCGWLYDSEIRMDLSTKRAKIPASSKTKPKNVLRACDIYTLFHVDTTLYEGAICKDYWIYAYRFQLLYGLRPGELMGLQWGDIDADCIHIRRSITAKGRETTGKNDFAQRDLPLTKIARDLLDQQKQYRHNPNNPNERVFGELSSICYRDRWNVYCKTNGIPYVTPYEIRHSFASINKLLPLWILDVLMGHAHAGISLGVYAHALEDDLEGVAELLDQNLTRQIEKGAPRIPA